MADSHRITEIRNERGMSIAGLARAAEITRPTVYAAEAGRAVDLDTLVKIAKALEVSLAEIAPDAARSVGAVA